MIAMRQIFEMVGDGNGIEPLLPGLPDTYHRPYRSIGKHRVHVKITFQHLKTICHRQENFIPYRLGHHLGHCKEEN